MVNKRFIDFLKRTAVTVTLFSVIASVSACTPKSKKELINYANDTYGACKVVKQNSDWNGSDPITVVYLKDKETGIEYYVSSTLEEGHAASDINPRVEHTDSNFDEVYAEYLLDEAKKDIKSLKKEYGFDIEYEDGAFAVKFDLAVTPEDGYDAADELDIVLDDVDIKNMRCTQYRICAKGDLPVAEYDVDSGEKQAYSTLAVADYVHIKFDATAEFDRIGTYHATRYFSKDILEEKIPGFKDEPVPTYEFKLSNGDTLAVIDLKDFGGEEEIYLFIVDGNKVSLIEIE